MSNDELNNKIEALLFSIGKKVTVDELCKMSKASPEEVLDSLRTVREKYDNNPSIMIVEDGVFWKMAVREDYLPLIQNIVTETELDKPTLETLAVIAFKNPALQSDVIKVRTNKAYDHMKTLEEAGYVIREKHGRTMSIKLTPKFFEYFDLPSDKMKEMFNSFQEVEKAIDSKEAELKQVREDVKAREADDKANHERAKQEEVMFEQKLTNVEKEYKLDESSSEAPAETAERADDGDDDDDNDDGDEEGLSEDESAKNVSGDVSEVQEQDELSDSKSDEKS